MASPTQSNSVQAEALPETSLGTILWLREMLQRTPWWAASAIFHLILLLAATMAVFATRSVHELQGTTIGIVRDETLVRPPVKSELTIHRGPPAFDDREGIVDAPEIYDPKAKISDHFESADDEPFKERKGQSFKFKDIMEGIAGGVRGSEKDSLLKATSDILGIGGGYGGGGRFGGPRGGREDLIALTGGSNRTQNAVLAGLRWLARHQHPEGYWSSDNFHENCRGPERCSGPGSRNHDAGLTGLALLAYLGGGFLPNTYTEESSFKDPFTGRTIWFADVVKKGLQWLLKQQDHEGCFSRQKGEFMYDHSICTLAVVEASWLCFTPLYKIPAQRGIDFLLEAQNPGFAWRYDVRPGDNDTSVTGWCVMALKSAELAGLRFDCSTYVGVLNWLDRVTNQRGVVGYQSPGDTGSYIVGINDRWEGHPAMTAVGLLARIYIHQKKNTWMKVAAREILRDLPVWDTARKTIDFYYWYYAALALFQYDAPDGPAWKAFNESMKNSLVPFQEGEKFGCRQGSWDPSVDKWGSVGGRVYATAINVLTLEVYYRYKNVFTGSRKKRA